MGADEAGTVIVSLGTSDTFFAAIEKPLFDENGCKNGSLARMSLDEPFGRQSNETVFYDTAVLQKTAHSEWMQLAPKKKGERDLFLAILGMSSNNSEAIRNTPLRAYNNGNQMKPFFVDEISPKVLNAQPELKGSEAFINWEDKTALPRACVRYGDKLAGWWFDHAYESVGFRISIE